MTVTVFMCDGTHNLLDWGGRSLIPLADNPLIGTTLPPLINTDHFTLQTITWPDAGFPMEDSINTGVSTLSAAIGALDGGDFILVGYSQGAAICSLVLQAMQSGSFTSYLSQCIGAVMFGNICRQQGQVAPVQTDPGGHGLWANHLLTSTPPWWWEFAIPLDAATTIPDTLFGVDLGTIFEAIIGSYPGSQNLMTFIHDNLNNRVRIDLLALEQITDFLSALAGLKPAPPGMVNLVAHGLYYNTAPPGNTLSCAQLAADYINGLAGGS